MSFVLFSVHLILLQRMHKIGLQKKEPAGSRPAGWEGKCGVYRQKRWVFSSARMRWRSRRMVGWRCRPSRRHGCAAATPRRRLRCSLIFFYTLLFSSHKQCGYKNDQGINDGRRHGHKPYTIPNSTIKYGGSE